MSKKLIFLASLIIVFVAAGVSGISRIDEYSNGGKRDIGVMAVWAKKMRAQCKIVGHGIDISKDWNRTDVLQCPDGTINIIPDGIGT